MTKKQIVMANPNDLKMVFDVRAALNDDRVMYFGMLYEAGTEIDPIIRTPDGTIVEGRHRREGAILAGRKEVATVITHESDPVKLISMAYRANADGALPPTRADMEHTISTLLGMKASHSVIADELGLPKSIVRKLITNIRSSEAHAKMRRAAHAVVEEGLTVAKAAEQFEVDPDMLRERLGGNKRRRRAGLDQIKLQLSRRQLSASKIIGERIRSLIDSYKDGEMPEQSVLDVLDHLAHLNAQAARRLADWRKRFDAARGFVPVVTEDPVPDASGKKKRSKTVSSAPGHKRRSNQAAGTAALRKMGVR